MSLRYIDAGRDGAHLAVGLEILISEGGGFVT
jgi:hypothetical protein